MSINYTMIGQRVKACRLQRQITQAALAKWIGMSVPYISYIETAKKKPSLESMACIASAFDVTVDYLLNGNQTNDPTTECRADLLRLNEDCTSYEKRIIYEIASATKRSLRESKLLQKVDDHL